MQQFGPHVPSIAFTEAYQEILSVWCGNYWGRSSAHVYVEKFIDALNSKRIIELAGMFRDNERVRAELFQKKSKTQAVALLKNLKKKVTIQAHKNEIEELVAEVEDL